MYNIGVGNLDRELGGIPEGSVVTITAPPQSNAERLLHQLISLNREEAEDVHYVTPDKDEKVMQNILDSSAIIEDKPYMNSLLSEQNKINDIKNMVTKINGRRIIAINNLVELEEGDSSIYNELINQLKLYAVDTDSLVLLYTTNTSPKNRHITTDLSDVVFEIDFEENSSENTPRLKIPKFRGEQQYIDIEGLNFREGSVDLDTSRGIT